MKRLIVLVGVTALLAAGCAGQGAAGAGPVDTRGTQSTEPPTEPPATSGPGTTTTTSPEPSGSGPTTSPTPSGTVTYEVWFTRDDRLRPVDRTQPATRAVGTAALTALFEGTSDPEAAAGFGTQVPPGTRLLGLSISDGVATADLSGEFLSGGSAVSEYTRIGQVVMTLVQFSTVDRVALRLEGDPIKTFDIEGRSLGRPWEPQDFEPLLAAIIVEQPTAGQTVDSPVAVSGTADVFEATVSLRLLDEDGNVLDEDFTTATCGTGCRGDFSAELQFEVDHEQRGTVMVFESSAEDGRPINVVRIPVTLTP